MGWQKSRDTIGQNRTWIVGRALVGVYFLTVGLTLLGIGLVLAMIFAVLDGIYTILFNRPLNFGRSWAHMIWMRQIKLAGYTLGTRPYPGLIPRREDGRR